MMRPTTVGRLIAFGVALALPLAADAAEQTPSPLIGATRDQVIARSGEPRSQIVVGNRVIMFFAKERVILRDGVVVDVEKIAEPKPVPTPPPPAATSTETTTTTTTAGERPVAPGAATAPATSGAAAPAPATGAPSTATPATETPSGQPEPHFEIKSIRRAGELPPRALPKQEPAPTPKTVQPPATPPVANVPAPEEQRPASTAPATTGASPSMVAVAPGVTTPTTTATVAPATPPEVEAPKPDDTPAEPVKAEKKAKPAKKVRKAAPSEPAIPDTEEIINSKGNYFIVFLVAATGVGYIIWRFRQRKLALAATAVSRAPFSAPVVAKSGVVFNADLLQKLEWKRFEELVASYYSKTGVVAVRTKSGPAAPVHIKISWKGEPRPFAYVQCIAQPAGLIESKPLQDLVNILAADDIRRGYVVSTGKFSVNARDLAEEKHITLLPGDIFLEKLNALPDAARSELMQQITTGDYTTPSCPKCEAKMVRSLEDPMIFRCPTHADQQIASRE